MEETCCQSQQMLKEELMGEHHKYTDLDRWRIKCCLPRPKQRKKEVLASLLVDMISKEENEITYGKKCIGEEKRNLARMYQSELRSRVKKWDGKKTSLDLSNVPHLPSVKIPFFTPTRTSFSDFSVTSLDFSQCHDHPFSLSYYHGNTTSHPSLEGKRDKKEYIYISEEDSEVMVNIKNVSSTDKVSLRIDNLETQYLPKESSIHFYSFSKSIFNDYCTLLKVQSKTFDVHIYVNGQYRKSVPFVYNCNGGNIQVEERKRKRETPQEQFLRCIHPRFSSSSMSGIKGLQQSIIDIKELEFQKNEDGLPVLLGRGTFGQVYKAKWHYQDVAVKRLHFDGHTKDLLEKFFQETSIMSQLSHENIVRLFGICEESPNQYLMVMEFMENGSLFHSLHQSNQDLNWSQRYQIVLDIANGIHHLHSQQIWHRDLKSLNVLLDKHLQAKISDFGLSKVKKEGTKNSTMGMIGTLEWMAPELFTEDGKFTEKSDIYSFGMILWEISSRKHPFDGIKHGFMIPLKIMNGEREPIPEGTPPLFAQLIQRCWQQDPKKRPNIHQVMQDLKNMESYFTSINAYQHSTTTTTATTTTIPVPVSSSSLSSPPTIRQNPNSIGLQQNGFKTSITSNHYMDSDYPQNSSYSPSSFTWSPSSKRSLQYHQIGDKQQEQEYNHHSVVDSKSPSIGTFQTLRGSSSSLSYFST